MVADAVKLGVEIMTEAEVRLEKELKNVDPMELGLVDAVTEEADPRSPTEGTDLEGILVVVLGMNVSELDDVTGGDDDDIFDCGVAVALGTGEDEDGWPMRK